MAENQQTHHPANMAFTNRISQFLTKIAFGASPRLYGRFSSGAGVGEEIGIGDGLVIESGSLKAVAVNLGNLTTSGFTTGHMLRIKSGGGIEGRTTAQVLSDIGAQAALTNYSTITGLTGFPGTSAGGYGVADSGKMAVFGSTGSLTISTGLLVNSTILGNTFVGAFTPRYIAGTQTAGANAGATWTISSPEFSSPSDSFVYNLPSKSGTFAMTSDIPSDVVKTSPQTLTEEEKAAARENIGVDMTRYSTRGIFAAVRATLKAGRSAGFAVCGDSTGNAATEWVNLLCSHIASEFPGHSYRHLVWNGTTWSTLAETILPAGEPKWVFPTNGVTDSTIFECSIGADEFEIPQGNTISVEAKITVADWSLLAADQSIVSIWDEYTGTSADRLLRFRIASTVKRVGLNHYDAANNYTTGISQTGVPLPYGNGDTFWIKATITFNNGSGSRINRYYYRTNDTDAWTQLGADVTGSVATLRTLTQRTPNTYAMIGPGPGLTYHKVRFSNSATVTDGTLPIAPIDHFDPGSASNLVTLGGSPMFTVRNQSVSGWDLRQYILSGTSGYVAPVTSFPHADEGVMLAFCNLGHNCGAAIAFSDPASYADGVATLLDQMKTRFGMQAARCYISQNPKNLATLVGARHRIRLATGIRRALDEGWHVADITRAFDDYTGTFSDLFAQADTTHPSDDGSALWAGVLTSNFDCPEI